MKQNKLFGNIMLTLVLGIVVIVCMVVRAFAPMAVLPQLDIPGMVLLSLIALVLEHYLCCSEKRWNILTLPAAALTFGLLPLAAHMVSPLHALKLGVVGGIVFSLTAWLYASIQERLATGPDSKLAPVFSAFGLYLASQCLMGIIL